MEVGREEDGHRNFWVDSEKETCVFSWGILGSMKQLKALVLSGEGKQFKVWGPKTADEASGLPADDLVFLVDSLEEIDKKSQDYLAFLELLQWKQAIITSERIHALGALVRLSQR